MSEEVAQVTVDLVESVYDIGIALEKLTKQAKRIADALEAKTETKAVDMLWQTVDKMGKS